MMASNKTANDAKSIEHSPSMKGCNTCRLVEVCYLYRMACDGINGFNAEAKGIMEFPMKPEALAFKCPKYESPLDVVKKIEASDV